MTLIKIKPATTMSGERPVYANGLLIGHIHKKSDHFRGKETHKRMIFAAIDAALPYRMPNLSEHGWTLRHMIQRIEDEMRIRHAATTGG